MPIVRDQMDLTSEVNRILDQLVQGVEAAVGQALAPVQQAAAPVSERAPSLLPEAATGAALLALIARRSRQVRARGATAAVEAENEEGY